MNNFNKKLFASLALLGVVATATLASCGKNPQKSSSSEPTSQTSAIDPTKVASVSIDQRSVELKAGQTTSLTASVAPATALNKLVIWKSSNKAVAKIDSDGVVTAVSVGETTITATSAQDSTKTDSIILRVTPTRVESVTVKESTKTINIGEEFDILYTVLPESATNKNVKFTVDNELVTVSETGHVTVGLIAGTSVITVSSEDNTEKSDTVTVTIVDPSVPTSVVAPELITIGQGDADTTSLSGDKVKIMPETAVQTKTFTSENTSVATVSTSGNIVTITGVATGTTKIKITSSVETVFAEVTINVVDPLHAAEVVLEEDNLEQNIDDEVQLHASIKPTSAIDQGIIWEAYPSSLATVSNTGLVTCLAAGEVEIVAKSHEDQSIKDSCHIKIVDPKVLVSLAMSEESANMTVGGEDKQLSVVYTPSTASTEGVSWESSNPAVATVSDAGLVTAVGEGTARITATSKQNSKITAKCDVTVSDPSLVKEIELSSSELTVKVFESKTLEATVLPETASNKGIEWSSNNIEVASVDANGIVTGNKVGAATITARSKQNGNIKATCDVTVTENLSDYTLAGVSEKASFTMYKANKSEQAIKDEEFVDRNQILNVGDDNNFNFKPILNVVNKNTLLPVPSSVWIYEFDVKVEVMGASGYETADSSYYDKLDRLNCEIDFSSLALNKEFKISVAPGGVEESKKEAYTKAIEFKVVDGYNAYSSKELGYIDQRHGDGVEEEYHDGDVGKNGFAPKWDAFKAENGLSTTLSPSAIILQDNVNLTKGDVPSSFFYTESELDGQTDKTEIPGASLYDKPIVRNSVGSMKDYCFLYTRLSNESFTFNGNYFKVDYSSFPLVTRDRGSTTPYGGCNSHSAVFRVRNGEFTLKNINISGNAPRAIDPVETAYGGGLMAVKAGVKARSFTADNIISRKPYILCLAEKTDVGCAPVAFTVKNTKSDNAYNSFIYNWGSTLTASNSTFKNCGGPIVIQDHTGVNPDAGELYEEDNGFKINGIPSKSTFIDCKLDNYVSGSEAWFNHFNAESIVGHLKTLCNFYNSKGLTYLFDKNNNPNVATSDLTFFNFVVFNKSSESEGITSYAVCGDVEILNGSDKEVFNYAKPEYKDLFDAFNDWMANTTDMSKIQALIDAAGKHGIEAPYPIDEAGINELAMRVLHLPETGMLHQMLRTVNKMGGPVFDNNGSFGYFDGSNNYLQPLSNTALKSTAEMSNSDPFVTTTSKHTAVYYDGMMMVFGLARLS